MISFYGNSSGDHAIMSKGLDGSADDDIRINSYGGVFINLDSNGNNDNSADFKIVRHSSTGAVSGSDTLFTLRHEDAYATFAGDVQVDGDLIVTGTSTTVNVEDLNVEQGEITLNYGTGDTSSNANNSGIRIQDAVNATTDATILWDQTNSQFTISHAAKVNNDLLIGDQAGSANTQAFGAFDQLRFDNSHSSSNVGPNKIVMHDNGSTWIGGFGIHSDTVSYYTGGGHRFYKTTSQTASTLLFESDSNKTEFHNDLEVGGLRIVHDNDSGDQQTAWIRSCLLYTSPSPRDRG